MWSELTAIREVISAMELVPLMPAYDSRDNDRLRMQELCSCVALSDSGSSVVLDIETMTHILTKMFDWLRHVRWVSGVMGIDWTVGSQYQIVFGEGGFTEAFDRVMNMKWSDAENKVCMSSSGLEKIQSFCDKVHDQSEQVRLALSTRIAIKAGDYLCEWIPSVVEKCKTVEQNIAIVRNEAARRKIEMDTTDAIFAMQTNRIILATKDELPASLASAYMSMDYIVDEMLFSTDMGLAKGAKVYLASEAQNGEVNVGAGEVFLGRHIVIWQDYIGVETLRELYKCTLILEDIQMLVSPRGLVVSLEDWRLVSDEHECKIQHLSFFDLHNVQRTFGQAPAILPYLRFAPHYKPINTLLLSNAVVEEFMRAVLPLESDAALTKYKNSFPSNVVSGYGDLMVFVRAAALDLWNTFHQYSQKVMQGWKGFTIMRNDHRSREPVVTTIRRLFLARIALLLTRNGKIRYVVNGRRYIISFYQKRVARGGVKACVLWDENIQRAFEIKNILEIPERMGMSWKEGVKLLRFIKIAKQRAMNTGCRVSLEDELLPLIPLKDLETIEVIANDDDTDSDGRGPLDPE